MMTAAGTGVDGEVTGLDQSIAYAEHLAAQAGRHSPDGNKAYLSSLAGCRRVEFGDGVDAVQLELTDAQLRELHERLALQLQLDAQDSDR